MTLVEVLCFIKLNSPNEAAEHISEVFFWLVALLDKSLPAGTHSSVNA